MRLFFSIAVTFFDAGMDICKLGEREYTAFYCIIFCIR